MKNQTLNHWRDPQRQPSFGNAANFRIRSCYFQSQQRHQSRILPRGSLIGRIRNQVRPVSCHHILGSQCRPTRQEHSPHRKRGRRIGRRIRLRMGKLQKIPDIHQLPQGTLSFLHLLQSCFPSRCLLLPPGGKLPGGLGIFLKGYRDL